MKKDKSDKLIILMPGNFGKDCKGNGTCFDKKGYLIKCLCGECEFSKCCDNATYPHCCDGCNKKCPRYYLNEMIKDVTGGVLEPLDKFKERLDRILFESNKKSDKKRDKNPNKPR